MSSLASHKYWNVQTVPYVNNSIQSLAGNLANVNDNPTTNPNYSLYSDRLKQQIRAAKLKRALVNEKYNPKRILNAMQRNKVNMNQPLTNENFRKYYEKPELVVEGVGQAYGPEVPYWMVAQPLETVEDFGEAVDGGKRRKTRRRKSKKRKTRKV